MVCDWLTIFGKQLSMQQNIANFELEYLPYQFFGFLAAPNKQQLARDLTFAFRGVFYLNA